MSTCPYCLKADVRLRAVRQSDGSFRSVCERCHALLARQRDAAQQAQQARAAQQRAEAQAVAPLPEMPAPERPRRAPRDPGEATASMLGQVRAWNRAVADET